MKKYLKIIALVLSLAMVIGIFAACSSKEPAKVDDNKTTEQPSNNKTDEPKGEDPKQEVKGEEKTWGNITVFIPEGMQLTGGSLIDKESKNDLSIQLTENLSHYYNVSIVEEETAINSVAGTKEINEGASDVSFTAGENTWTGVAYKYASTTDCFQVYSTINGKVVLITAGWNAYDSAETNAILASIKVAGE